MTAATGASVKRRRSEVNRFDAPRYMLFDSKDATYWEWWGGEMQMWVKADPEWGRIVIRIVEARQGGENDAD